MSVKIPTVKECVKDGQKVFFKFYRKGYLHYFCEGGGQFHFKVPVSDCGDAKFKHEDKAMLFMRYIRKEIKELEAAQAEA